MADRPMLTDALDLRDRREPELLLLADIVGAVRDIAPREQVLLIGAQVRDLLLRWSLGIDLERLTRDVDFAIGVDSWDHFRELRRGMLDSGRFHATTVQHKLRFGHPDGTIVDIVPFGGVEASDRSLAWPPDQAIVMSAIGFREAFEHSIVVVLAGGTEVRVASLAAFAALKLFAWPERDRRARSKDATDLHMVLGNYGRVVGTARLYEIPDAVLEATGGDNDSMAAWHLGRDIAEILASGDHEAHFPRRRLLELLERESRPDGPAQLAADMDTARLVANLQLLDWVRRGLAGESG